MLVILFLCFGLLSALSTLFYIKISASQKQLASSTADLQVKRQEIEAFIALVVTDHNKLVADSETNKQQIERLNLILSMRK